MPPARKPVPGKGVTPQGAQRNVPGAPDTTRPASPSSLPQRKPTHAVQGPPSLPHSGRPLSTPSAAPPLHGSSARVAQTPQTVGVNPRPPAKRSKSAPADSVPPIYPGDCIIGPYNGLAC